MTKKTSKRILAFALVSVGFLAGFFLGRYQKGASMRSDVSYPVPFPSAAEPDINEQTVTEAIAPAEELCNSRYYSANAALSGSFCIGVDFSRISVSVTEADEDNYNIAFRLPALEVLSSDNADLIPEQEALLQNSAFQADTKSRVETALRLLTEDFVGRSNATVTFVWEE